MCGIAAICGAALDPADEAIVRMVHAIRHRGPDAQTHQRLDGCHLGHARLSIIDLETGAQPMPDMRGQRWITFNGEIYNYRELRAELETLGYSFATHSDTEVILAAYGEWGSACLDRLRGMYAFAIWDVTTRRLFAARDIFGEKPLYYAIARGNLVLGSELKAIMASGLVSNELSRAGIDGYLALGYVPPDCTVYEHVQSLPPGHYLEWNGRTAHVGRYWAPHARPRIIGTEEAAEELRRLLRQAVRRQMVADVPVGAFLSGGHDSSAVVALMREIRGGPLQTFSVGFGEHINELPYARHVAQRYETEHHELDLADPPVNLVEWTDGFSRELLGRPVRRIPYSLLQALGRLGDVMVRLGIRNFPMTTFRLCNMTSDNIVATDSINSVAWPLPYSMRDGIHETVDWLRKADGVRA